MRVYSGELSRNSTQDDFPSIQIFRRIQLFDLNITLTTHLIKRVEELGFAFQVFSWTPEIDQFLKNNSENVFNGLDSSA